MISKISIRWCSLPFPGVGWGSRGDSWTCGVGTSTEISTSSAAGQVFRADNSELRNSSILLPMQVPSSEIFKVIPSFFPSRKHHAERRKPEVLVPAKGVEDLQSDQAKSEQEQVKRKKGEKKEGRVKNSEFFSAVKSLALSPATTRRRKRRRKRRMIRFNSFSVFCRLDCWGGEGEFDHFWKFRTPRGIEGPILNDQRAWSHD